MANMFNYCKVLESLDLSSFKTSKVTTMTNMFNGCVFLPEIDVSNFDLSSLTNMTGMFTGCACDVHFTNKKTNNVTTAFAILMYSMELL